MGGVVEDEFEGPEIGGVSGNGKGLLKVNLNAPRKTHGRVVQNKLEVKTQKRIIKRIISQ